MRYLALALILVGCGRQKVTLNGHAYTPEEIEQGNAWLGSDCLPDVVFLSEDEIEARFGDASSGRLGGIYQDGVAYVVASSPDAPLWKFTHTKYVHEIAHHVSWCRGDGTDPNHEVSRDLWLRAYEWWSSSLAFRKPSTRLRPRPPELRDWLRPSRLVPV